jgi:ABC-type multidrug transport system ATPase subunit
MPADDDYITMAAPPGGSTASNRGPSPARSPAVPSAGVQTFGSPTTAQPTHDAGLGIMGSIRLWLIQFYTLLWIALLLRGRRKLHTFFEILSPAMVFLVLLYGVLAAPAVTIPGFVHNSTPVVNQYSPTPLHLSPATSEFAQVVQAEYAGGAASIAAKQAYLDNVLLGQILAVNSTDAAQLATNALADFSAANPTQIPSLDAYIGQQRIAANTIGRQGLKGLQHLSAFVWSVLHMGKLAFAPDTAAVRDIMAYLDITTESYWSIAYAGGPFPSAEAAISALGTDLWAVVQVNNVDFATGVFDYTIRMNETQLPKSSQVVDPFPQGLGADYAMYLHSGFATLEYELNDYFLRRTASAAGLQRTAASGLASVASLCNTYVGAATGDSHMFDTAFPADAPTNAYLTSLPATRTVTPITIQDPAAFVPCQYEAVASCGNFLALDNTVVMNATGLYACVAALPAAALSDACSAALSMLQAGSCAADLARCRLNNTASALFGPNVTEFPALPCLAANAALQTSCLSSPFLTLLTQALTINQPCALDLDIYCPGIGSSLSSQAPCLLRVQNQLSPFCRAAVTTLAGANGNMCFDDLTNLCPFAGTLNSVPTMCLAANGDVLSQSCFDSALYTTAKHLAARYPLVRLIPVGQSLCQTAGQFVKMFDTGIAVGAFPASGYEQSQFYKNSGALFGLVSAMAFVFQFTSFVRYVVQERESKQKTLLLAAGTGRGVILMSHLFVGLICAVASSFFAMCVLYAIMPHVHSRVTYGILFLYAWSLVPMSLIVARLAKQSRTAATLAPLLLFAMSAPAFVTIGHIDALGYLFSPSITVFAFNIVALFTQSSAPLASLTPGLEDAMIIMLGQSLVYVTIVASLEACAEAFRRGVISNCIGYFKSTVIRRRRAGSSAGRSVEGDEERLVSLAPRDGEEMGSFSPSKSRFGNNGGESAYAKAAVKFDGVTRHVGRPLRDVSFAVPRNSLSVLVGGTGSGKSTCLNILFDVSSYQAGKIEVFGDALGDVDRTLVGCCLQRDVIWEALTVREHIDVMQAFKGDTRGSDEDRRGAVTGLIRALDLDDVQHTRASKLPRGKLRQLSVAMAFAGSDTTLVLLDAPTDGVDPEGTQCILTFLNRRKLLGTTVVMTSGAFRDAESADHVVFMDRGGVVCEDTPKALRGSTVYLLSLITKRPFKVITAGNDDTTADRDTSTSSLPFVRDPAAPGTAEHLREAVQRALPSAVVDYQAVDEIRFAIPADGDDGPLVAEALQRLLRDMPTVARATLSTASLDDVLGAALKAKVEERAKAFRELVEQAKKLDVVAPIDAAQRNDDSLSDQLGEMGEAMLHEAGAEGGDGSAGRTQIRRRTKAERRADLEAVRMAGEDDRGDALIIPVSEDEVNVIGSRSERDNRQKGCKLHMRMVMTVFTMRWAEALGDTSNLWMNFVLPLVCVALALRLMSIPDPTPDFLSLDAASMYGTQSVPFTIAETPSYNKTAYRPGAAIGSHGPMHGAARLETGGLEFSDVTQFIEDSIDMSSFLDDTRYGLGDTKRYGALVWYDHYTYFVNDSLPNRSTLPTRIASLSELPLGVPVDFTWSQDTVLHNTSSAHALPSFANLLHTLRLRARLEGSAAATTAKLSVNTHPIPAGVQAITTERIARNLISVMLLLLPFTFFPANNIAHVVKERNSGFLRVITTSYLSPYHHWIGTFAWNMFCFFAFALVAIFIFSFFGPADIFGGSSDSTTTFFLMVMYGACAIAVVYMLSPCFKKSSTAQNAVMMSSILTGFIFVASWSALYLMPDSDATRKAKDANSQLGDVLRLLPSFALGQGFVKIAMAPVLRFLGDNTSASAQAAPSMALMGLFPLYFVFIFLAEYLWRTRRFQAIRRCTACSDEDAATDENATATTGSAHAALTITNVSVKYTSGGVRGHIQALDHVSFTVPRGQRTCIVGRSGAGKTTLASVLSGSVLPNGGSVATDKGLDAFYSGNAYTRGIGVSLERGAALEGSLTPYLLLHLMADLRGLRVNEYTNGHVLQLLRDLGLFAVRYSRVMDLSEATRRRVAVAMAFVAYPPLIILDEPTAGIDPVHRRLIWQAIRTLPPECTVIVTTGDADEALRFGEHIVELTHGEVKYAGPTAGWSFGSEAVGRLRLSLRCDGDLPARQRHRAALAGLLAQHVIRRGAAQAADKSAAVTDRDFVLEGDPKTGLLDVHVTGDVAAVVRGLHDYRTDLPQDTEIAYSLLVVPAASE